jgi:hypothetical protein
VIHILTLGYLLSIMTMLRKRDEIKKAAEESKKRESETAQAAEANGETSIIFADK